MNQHNTAFDELNMMASHHGCTPDVVALAAIAESLAGIDASLSVIARALSTGRTQP